jgi:glycine cleavage system aminomethyltransferase T
VTLEQIIDKRGRLLEQLPDARDILRGSLLERNIHHSAGRCKRCDSGGGHPVSVLTVGYPGGRMHQISLRKEQAAHVKQCLENYYSLKAALEEICELNQQLLRAKPAAVKKGRKR